MLFRRTHHSPLSIDSKGRLCVKTSRNKWFVIVKGIADHKTSDCLRALIFKGISIRL